MNKDLYRKITSYRTALAVIKEMLRKGIIDENDSIVICTNLAEKNGLRSSTIFSEIDLITGHINDNIYH